MAGINPRAVREAIQASIRAAGMSRDVAVYAYPPESLAYPAVTIGWAQGDYAITFGAAGIAQMRFAVDVRTTAAEIDSAAIALDDLLSAGTGAASSVYDALTADPTFGAAVGGSAVTDFTPPRRSQAVDGTPEWVATFVVTATQPRS